jgi:hypothetical protein
MNLHELKFGSSGRSLLVSQHVASLWHIVHEDTYRGVPTS